MHEVLFDIALWSPVPFALALYFFAGRYFKRTRSRTIFDCAVVALVVVLPVCFFYREITGQISADIWADEREWMPLLVPMWTAFIDILLLLIAGAVRGIRFSTPNREATPVA